MDIRVSHLDSERKAIRAFIARSKQAQYLSRLSSHKTRQKFMNAHLHHMKDLDRRYATRIKPTEWTSAGVYQLLCERGAPARCYVISATSNRDGQLANLRTVLDEVVGIETGTFVVCIPSKLGYFEGEERGEQFLLER